MALSNRRKEIVYAIEKFVINNNEFIYAIE